MRKHAVISPCGRYRYQLLREWDTKMPVVLFIMLNPSKADADNDDPTIRRCIDFAQRWGFGGLMVGNLWAYRATDPKELKNNPETSPTGDWLREINERHVDIMAAQCELVIFAWGVNKYATDSRVKTFVDKHPTAKAITISKHGKPVHPLFLRRTLTPINYIPHP